MAEQELRRVVVLGRVLEGQLPLQDAAKILGIGYRHAKRLKQRFKQLGPEGMVHGNRGRAPPNRLDDAVKQRILELADGKYAGVNDTHFRELLEEREGIVIGRETLRRLLRRSGRPPKRRRRPKRHHRRRERSPAKGMMLLWDGSQHRWFGPKRPACSLLAAVDDADGELVEAFFAPQETSEAYLRLLQGILRRRGIPISIYMDRHGALKRSDPFWTLEEQLAGRRTPTQVGIVLNDLDIRPIYALSPQAKGRVERLFGTLQDRLLEEMKLDGIRDIEAGNAYLKKRWISRYNKRFRQKSPKGKTCYRSSKGLPLHDLLAFRYEATVANDNTVSLGGLTIQIPPGPNGRGYAKARVDIHHHLTGTWSVFYHQQRIATAKATPLNEPLRKRVRNLKKKERIHGAIQERLEYSPLTNL